MEKYTEKTIKLGNYIFGREKIEKQKNFRNNSHNNNAYINGTQYCDDSKREFSERFERV